MQDFILTLSFNIQGIGAASGIIHDHGKLLLVSDNSRWLYTYEIGSGTLSKKMLDPAAADNIAKKEKPDFEALALFDGNLYLFGSGSTPKRNNLAKISHPDQTDLSIFDLSNLYAAMREISGITTDDFNIEGATTLDGKWFLFQRGNGPAKRNGIFTITGAITENACSIVYRDIALPDCNGIPATFTDALAVNDKIYFIGTAENSESVYDDGEILGSMLGRLNPQTMEIDFNRLISHTHKFEGLALLGQTASEITFLLCEDNDTEASESGIYELRIPL